MDTHLEISKCLVILDLKVRLFLHIDGERLVYTQESRSKDLEYSKNVLHKGKNDPLINNQQCGKSASLPPNSPRKQKSTAPKLQGHEGKAT